MASLVDPQQAASLLDPQQAATLLDPQQAATLLDPQQAATLLDSLLASLDRAEQRRWLTDHPAAITAAFMSALKARVDRERSRDSDAALDWVALMMHAAGMSGSSEHKALALLAEGNVRALTRGEFAAGKARYLEAAALYRGLDRPVDEARVTIGLYWALVKLGETGAAEGAVRRARESLTAHREWFLLGCLVANHGAVQSRAGDDEAALLAYIEADEHFSKLGAEAEIDRAQNDQNIGHSKAVLGDFEGAIAALESAAGRMVKLGMDNTDVARAKMNLVVIHALRGRINEALNEGQALLQVFGAAKDKPGLAWVHRSMVGWQLQMRRYAEAHQLCQEVKAFYHQSGSHQEEGETWLMEAEILAGMGRLAEARDACAAAAACFAAGRCPLYWLVRTALQEAAIALRAGNPAHSLDLALHCVNTVDMAHHVVDHTQACLLAAQALIALDRPDQAIDMGEMALASAQWSQLPWLAPACQHLLGQAAQRLGNHRGALLQFHRAIRTLESLNRSLMIEYRSQHLADQPPVYADAVLACLALGHTAKALSLADRAKSRALVDLLDQRIDLTVRARSPADKRLVGDLHRMNQARNQSYRRWVTEQVDAVEVDLSAAQAYLAENAQLQADITATWHRLLVANADYANDAALWRVQAFAPQPLLEPDTALVEYFVAGDQLVAFVATRAAVFVHQADWDPSRLQNLEGWLQLNFDAVAEARAAMGEAEAVDRGAGGELAAADRESMDELVAEANELLQSMHAALLAPIAAHYAGYRHLIIVPHGILHHLPFHAFHDGRSHLIERHRISRLPAANLLRHLKGARQPGRGVAAIGHSFRGRLPFAPLEAQAVAAIWGTEAYSEQAATLAQLRRTLASADIVHLAAHMVWEPEAPLFSRMTLEDGEFTAFDVFNGPPIPARLVTLSGCNTARGVLSGGDEELGLIRALLHAGVSSLIASQWPIEDAASAQFMTQLHSRLAKGMTTGQAIQGAALAHIHPASDADARYRHPCYWAPFMLVGRDQALV